ncbi:MAG: hypothetical protein R2854_16510 [Caldilineaceae bacterium]
MLELPGARPQQCRTARRRRLANILQSATLPPPDFIAANLINDLDEIETPLIIVLDDFHFIEHADTLRLTASLLRYLPHHIHLIMITQRPGAALGPDAGKAGTGRNSGCNSCASRKRKGRRFSSKPWASWHPPSMWAR